MPPVPQMPLHQTVQWEGDDVVQVLNLEKAETLSQGDQDPGKDQEAKEGHRSVRGRERMKEQRRPVVLNSVPLPGLLHPCMGGTFCHAAGQPLLLGEVEWYREK